MPWWKDNPESLDDVKKSIQDYPDLNVSFEDDLCIVSGLWRVYGKEKHIVDYEIRIELSGNYPEDLPEVFETSKRIPRDADFHINGNGTCCLEVPPKRYEVWPPGESFKVFLDVLIHNFFHYQACKKLGVPYKYGEWSHEGEGIYEYYGKKFDIDVSEKKKINDLLAFSLILKIQRQGKKCPCGSGKWFVGCHQKKIDELLKIVPHKERFNNLKCLTYGAQT